eukprot:13237907-Heterocapsa_arctica.AAC.1
MITSLNDPGSRRLKARAMQYPFFGTHVRRSLINSSKELLQRRLGDSPTLPGRSYGRIPTLMGC